MTGRSNRSSALEPSSEQLEAPVDERATLAREALDLVRAERTQAARFDGTSWDTFVFHAAMAGAFASTGAFAVFAALEAWSKADRIGMAVKAWAVFLVVIAAVSWIVLRNQRRTADRQQAITELAHARGGRPVSLDHAVQWLNAHWAAAYNLRNLCPGAGYVAATGATIGFPVLIEFDPTGYMPRSSTTNARYPARLDIFVAANLPALAVDPAGAQVIIGELAGFGIFVEVTPSGLHGRGQPFVVSRLRREPLAIAELADVVDRMAGIAQRLGGAPGHPLP